MKVCCEDCQGTGVVDCPDCRGSGEVMIAECFGGPPTEQWYPCPNPDCDDGQVVCPNCGGVKFFEEAS